MGKVVAIQAEKAKKSPSRRFSYYLENPKTDYLFSGTDEHGKTVYFFKMHITGLYDRVFGPYASRAKAVDCFDTVLMGALESFCTCNTLERNSKSNSGTEHIALPENLTPVPARKDGDA